jgi:hypothetical protein
MTFGIVAVGLKAEARGLEQPYANSIDEKHICEPL